MATDPPNPQSEIDSGEDWKRRVKAEDAALDQEFSEHAKPEVETNSTPEANQNRSRSEPPNEFPEATFEGLIGMLSTQAMLGMGAIPNPATKKAERQLPMARYFIDLIAVLEQKTAGQLTAEETTALSESLHSLRMAYVQFAKETN